MSDETPPTLATVDGLRRMVEEIEAEAERHEAEALRLRKILSDLRDALNGRARKRTGEFKRKRTKKAATAETPAAEGGST